MEGFTYNFKKKERVPMRTIKQTVTHAGWLVVLAGCLIFSTASFVAAENDTSEMSVAGAMFIEGSVRKVVLETDTITVKNTEGKRVRVVVSPETDLTGMYAFTEVKKERRVKVWYHHVGNENRAVKVELLPDLGC